MNGLVRPTVVFCWAATLALLTTSAVSAATADTLRVIGERVNLRAGPSDEATVRSQLRGRDLTSKGAGHGRCQSITARADRRPA